MIARSWVSAAVAVFITAQVQAQAPAQSTPCAGAASRDSALTSKEFVYRDGLSTLNPDLDLYLDYVGKKSHGWPDPDFMPSACKTVAEGLCELNRMQSFDVDYFDCTESQWTYCRCNLAEMSQSDMRDSMARVPPKLRSYVRHVMAFPSPANATSFNQDVIFYGSVASREVTTNALHQTAHALDTARGNFSAQDTWHRAVDGDTCVADFSAQASYSEAFAQAMVVHIHQQSNSTVSRNNTECMDNQLRVLREFFPREWLFEETCDLLVKPDSSATVSKYSGGEGDPNNSSSGSGSSPTDASVSGENTNKRSLGGGAIAGIVLGSFAIGLLLAFFAYMKWSRRKINSSKQPDIVPYGPGSTNMIYPRFNDGAMIVGADGTRSAESTPRPYKEAPYSIPPNRMSPGALSPGSNDGTGFSIPSPPSYVASLTQSSGR